MVDSRGDLDVSAPWVRVDLNVWLGEASFATGIVAVGEEGGIKAAGGGGGGRRAVGLPPPPPDLAGRGDGE